MKKFWIFASLITIILNAQAQPGSDLRVVSEDSRSIVLEFTPVFSNRTVVANDGVEYTRFDFQGAISEQGKQGAPILPHRATIINLPAREFTLQVVAVDYQDVAGVRVATYPKFVADKVVGAVPVYTAPREEFMTNEFTPVEIAELTNVGEARGFHLGTLKIHPVQVASARGMARIYSRIVVRLEFHGEQLSAAPSSLFMKSGFPSGASHKTPAKSQKSLADSPLAIGTWYKMEVRDSGIYKLDQAFFTSAGISSSSIGNINSIRIFGHDGKELPEDLNASRPNGLEEIARLVVDNNNNGTFDSDDFVLFYGKSTRGWKYDPNTKTYSHYINHYTETNQYFITFGGATRGKDMGTIASTSVSTAYKPTDFQGKVFREDELTNFVNSGKQWVGHDFSYTDNSTTYTTDLPGVVASKPVYYRFKFFSRSTSIDTFRVQENNEPLGSPISMYPVDIGEIISVWTYESPVISYNRIGALPNDRSVLRFTFGTRNQTATGWIDWFEIVYRQRFEAVSDLLLFSSPDTLATVEYNISKLSSRDVKVFEVSQHNVVQQITNVTFDPADASVCRFQVAQAEGSEGEFAVVGPKGYKTPTNAKRISNSNLQGNTAGAEFVIISPQEFLTQAERLEAHREKNDQLNTVVVDVEQIFNEFSTGMPDPMAIRDYLKYAYDNWAIKPGYVLLFGGANFDFKNIKSSDRNWIPPYESFESNHQILTFTSDDFFAYLNPGIQRISLAIGRLPVRSANEAKEIVDKIIAYETTAPFDVWRNKITFVADDAWTTIRDDGSLHTNQANTLAEIYTPKIFQKDKIYIVEYPVVLGASGRTKPSVNQAIVNSINRGTLIVNYTGHGNTLQWAHENIFNRENDFGKLKNTASPFFLVAATCDYARFDKPDEKSAGEQLLVAMDGGAIAVVTAARVVYADDNAALNYVLYSYLFQRDSLGRPIRLGDAMLETKQTMTDANSQKHHLLGDPTMRLAMPRTFASVDSVNGQTLSDGVTVEVQSLSKVSVTGIVKKPTGGAWNTFNGRALLEMFDSKRKVKVPEWGDYEFDVTGSLLYRGEVSVKNGAYQAIFPVPRDVSFDGNRARVSLYAWSDSTDAIGYSENVVISGTASGATNDTTGPRVTIRFDDSAFRPGDIVKPDATLIVDLSDESGINTSTAGIGHRLEASIDNSSSPLDLSNYYRGNLDTYASGQVSYPLTSLTEGRHSIAIKAWDIYNNSSTAETYFEVRASSLLSIYNVFNYPNPFVSATTFTFQRNSLEPIDVEVKVYTLTGRLIETISVPSVAERFVQIPWSGRDRDGNELANGVYFYKVIAKSQDRSTTSEVLGKLTVLR